jgi:hypothetical protein
MTFEVRSTIRKLSETERIGVCGPDADRAPVRPATRIPSENEEDRPCA